MPDEIEPADPAPPTRRRAPLFQRPQLPASRGPAADAAAMAAQMDAGRSQLAHPDEVGDKNRRIMADQGRTRALRKLAYARPDLGLNTNTRAGQYDWEEHDRLEAGGAAADARAEAEAARKAEEAERLDVARGRFRDVIDVDGSHD